MTEEDLPPEEESPETEAPPSPPGRPPQIVEIKTPLDKPEFSWFLETFMKKNGLSDRKQAAIMLTNMFYDMGLDPYADVKELQDNLQQMNALLQGLPNTPAAMQVKDTLGAMYAAKAGRAMIQKMPKVTGQDEGYDRMEKIMDKYMPMLIMMKSMASFGESQPQQANNKEKAEVPEELKAEMAAIKDQLAATQELLKQQTEDKKQREFHDEILNSVHGSITPQIDALRNEVATITSALNSLSSRPAAEPTPQAPSPQQVEMREISTKLNDAIDKLGEKAGAKNLSLDDMNTFLGTLETLEKRFKKEAPTAGEFDWRTSLTSGLTEIGKEAVSVFKELQGQRPPGLAAPAQQPQQNTEMQAIIKRQVQNYILQRLNAGDQKIDLQVVAQALGISLEQAVWGYNILKNEGWFNQPAAAAPQQQTPPTQPPAQGGTPPVNSARESQPFIET